MPSVMQVVHRGNENPPREGDDNPDWYSSPEYSPSQEKKIRHSYPVIRVGAALFVIMTEDQELIGELSDFSETLRGSPRAEVRFTNRLFLCTQQGKLRPWGWQHLPCRAA